MNTLLPIIPRKRRPLLPVESSHDLPTAVVQNGQHSKSNIELPEVESQSRLTSAATTKETSDAKSTLKRKTR
jgi:hypothetical protein